MDVLWKVGIAAIVMIGLTMWALHPNVCIDGSQWFIDRNKPDDPSDDYAFGPMIGRCAP